MERDIGAKPQPRLAARFNAVCRFEDKQAANPRSFKSMEKEYIDRAKAIHQGILQLRDSL